MDPRARRLAGRSAAVLAGCGLAFFLVLAPLFTDGPRTLLSGERLASLALTSGAYLGVGVLLGLLDPRDTLAAMLLAAPALALAAFYATSEPGLLGLAALYVILAFVGSLAGLRVAGLRRAPSR